MKKYIYLIIFVLASQLAFAQTSKDTIKEETQTVKELKTEVDVLKREIASLEKDNDRTSVFIGIVAALIGISVTLLVGYQIYNAYELSKNVVDTKKDLEDAKAKIEEVKKIETTVKEQEDEIKKIKVQIEKIGGRAQVAAKATYINKLFAEALNEQNRNLKISYFNQIIDIAPNHFGAYYNRGKAYFELEEYGEAIKDYTEAIRINSNDAEVYNDRSLTYEILAEQEGDEVKKNEYLELAKKDMEEYERLKKLGK